MKKETQYTAADLARALIRQYLSQKELKTTLASFEKQEPNNKKKISKTLLIELTSMKNLCQINKQMQGQGTLLEILVTYLNKKHQAKNGIFQRTDPHFYPQVNLDPHRKAHRILQTTEFSNHRVTGKQRPVSSNTIKREENPKTAQVYEKSDLKVIYDKVSRVESKLKGGNDKQTKGQVKVIHKKMQVKPKQEKIQVKPHKSIPNIQPLEIEEEQQQYKEQFQMSLPENTNKQTEPSLYEIKADLVSNKIITRTAKEVSSDLPIIQEKHMVSLHCTLVSQRQQLLKQQKIGSRNDKGQHIEEAPTRQEVKTISLKRQVSEDKISIVPIVNESANLQLQSKPSKIQQNYNQQSMGCVQSNKAEPPKPIPTRIIVQAQQQIPQTIIKTDTSQQRQIHAETSAEPPSKPRTQMRLLGKNKDSSNNIPESKQIEKLKSEARISPPVQQIIKKQSQVKKQAEVFSEPKQPVMLAIGKKKKEKQQTPKVDEYPTKFKFDDNFSHGIPVEESYQYEPYNINTFYLQKNVRETHPTLILDGNINYKVKGGGLPPYKKKGQKTLPSKDAQKLKMVVFQSNPPVLPKSWAQGFILSPFQNTFYGLKQIQGGPCGIIAAVQCYYLKHLLYLAKQSNQKNEIVRQMSLVGAIADLLWKVRSSQKITLTFPPKGASKIDINNLRVVTFDAGEFSTVFSAVWAHRDEYIGEKNFGVAALLYSAVLTKGPEKIEEQVDIKSNPLIGNHGHCTQQFVNMVLTGKACSNVFDGQKVIDDYKIKGILEPSQFGFLTVFQTLKYIEVGKNLKNPVIPAWIICKEFHYHVVFAGHHLIADNNKIPKFDIVYFDGLYNCEDRIRLTLSPFSAEQQQSLKIKELPLIEQVLLTKWGPHKTDWNGSTKIL